MNNPQAFLIDIDVYTSHIHILHNHSTEQFNDYLQQNFKGIEFLRKECNAATTMIFTYDDGPQEYVIDFNSKMKKGNPFDTGTIAHEALHVTFEICERLGIRYDIENQEAFAYLHGYIVQKIYEGLWGKK